MNKGAEAAVMERSSVGVVYGDVQFFKWKIPIGCRKRNHFVSEKSELVLDIKNGELREVIEKRVAILARLCLKKAPSRVKGLVGKVEIDEESVIELKVTDVDGVRVEVTHMAQRPWVFVVDRGDVCIRRDGLMISAKTRSYCWDPENTHVVVMEYAVQNRNLAKVLGVLICTLLFDYQLDCGSHI